jgi:hypothetical protein
MIRLLLSTLLALPALAVVTPASADCDMAGPLEEELQTAEVAFVGEVTSITGARAMFAVREIWSGNIADSVEVRGLGDEGRGPVPGVVEGPSEDDRSWAAGTTYLVVPYVDGNVLRDHICTATTQWTEDLAILRPADARVVVEAARPPVAIALIAIVSLTFLAISLFAFRRRSV